MLALTLSSTHAYVASFQPPRASRVRHAECSMDGGFVSRRETAALAALAALGCRPAWAADYAYQPALQGKDYGKTEMGGGPDFTKTPSGLSYKDAKVGKGKTPAPGDRVVIEWTGYTIGYFGRPFETKKLRELDGDQAQEYFRFVLGKGTVIPALEEGVATLAEGGVRQLVVPPSIGYPKSDPGHEKVGVRGARLSNLRSLVCHDGSAPCRRTDASRPSAQPKPATFSGQRALDFVLQNQELIDKTLLFNVKLIRVDPADGKGGFKA